ncbi:SpoIIE family protein phosphatase [Desulfonema magnum]|uniref:Two component system response regulator/histidine kinase, PAS domain-containing n=1 Tax=Desulfonema magnum TaxID=45655 RepID=A0A975BPX5_9BACT|nr:SpoIIE family protein phosphatase [Desulfonema magnum]QTA88915.1 Two component system response regulator/histidine kinase, PAS domain-containing [Desulfonema magnum]
MQQQQTQLKLLIVDDDPDITQLISRVLMKLSYDIRTATSASEALNILRGCPTDILITDIDMPGMNGIKLMEEVLRLYPNTVAIGITGYGNIDFAVNFMKRGGTDFLQKPINVDTIKFAVNSAAEKYRLKQELRRSNEELRRNNIALQKEIKARVESDELNKKLFETHSAIMLVIDPETGDIVNANLAACNYYGYSKKEIARLKITDLNTLTKEEVFAEMNRAKTQEKNFFCFRHRLANGEIREVEVISVPTKMENRQFLYSTIRDVSRRIRAEKALQASEQRYREVFENAPVGIYQASVEGKFLKVNPAMARIFGYSSADEMISDVKNISEQIYTHKDHRKKFFEKIRKHRGWLTIEEEYFRKDKTIIIAKVTLRLVRDEHENPLYVEGFIEDVTEKRQQEDAFNLEMSRAKELHDLVLEPRLPIMPGLQINIKCLPAECIGGDVLEFLKLDDKRLLVFLADVTGHGIPAAITGNTLKMLFRELSETDSNPVSICQNLNQKMHKIILTDDIIAAFCGQIDLESMKLTYCLCGIPSPIILRNHERIYLKPTGLPLGVFDDATYDDRTLTLMKNDTLVAFTDGITEAKAEHGEIFGLKRVADSIGKGKYDVHTVIDNIIKKARAFQKKETFRDDVIIFKVNIFDEHESLSIKPRNRFCSANKCRYKIKTKYISIGKLVRFFTEHMAEKSRESFDNLKKLRIAFFEMLTNAIEHGNLELTDLKRDNEFYDSKKYREIYKNRIHSDKYGERLICIECLYSDKQLEISIEDEGKGFNIKNVPDPTHEDNITKLSGRGIAIAKMNTDQVTYNAKGNKVVLRHKIIYE